MTHKTLALPEFHIDDRHDLQNLSASFDKRRRLHIPNFLTPAAAQMLHRHLADDIKWSVHLGGNGSHWEGHKDYSLEERNELAQFAYSAARTGFAYYYEGNRHVSTNPEKRARDPSPLARFIDFANSPEFVEFITSITNTRGIARVDGQASCYRPGHFLTRHDDSTTLKAENGLSTRQAIAYVMNLTPQWQPEWGGFLEFFGNDGHITDAWGPAFNALNIFSVPQVHCVSFVTPFAEHARYSVSGWLYVASPETSYPDGVG